MSAPSNNGTVIPIRPLTRPEVDPIAKLEKARQVFSPEFIQQFTDPQIRQQNALKANEGNRVENKKLTRKQQRFLAELLADPGRNVSAAMRKAGYTEGSIVANSYMLVQHPQIKAAIEEADKKIFTKLEITHEKVLQEMATIAFANLGDFLTPDPKKPTEYLVDLGKVTKQQASAIKEYTIEETPSGNRRARVSLYDKMSALQLLGKHLGIFSEKSPSDGTITINMIDRIVAGGRNGDAA